MMTPETWFWYVIATVFGAGIGVVLVIYIAGVLGIYWGDK